ncbi:MAG: hypothetical protein KKI09_16235 [Spirochaetes bacterium]|nr:hypothetical protein [Spirochaetota bacterium]MBU0956972.1 hypothetical protein [Spirochaetota bacterium]
MSDITQANSTDKPRSSVRQKIFNLIGWLSFLLLVPPVLSMAGLPQLQEMIVAGIGNWGSILALILYFYGLLFLRVFFGSDQRYTPVLIGYIFSFLLFSISLDIAFMRWLYDLAHSVSFLSYNVMSFIAAVFVILLANALSGSKRVKPLGDLLLLVLLPSGALVAAGIFLPGLLGLA